ncbi:MAG: N-acetyltransferase family protein [Polyangia bacterium]|jgi:phosphinothricin acetyltransferase
MAIPVAENDLCLQLASQADLDRIVATYNASIPSRLVTADLQPVTVDSRLPWFAAHDPTRRPLWLIVERDQYRGWLSLQSFYGRPAYDGVAEVSLYLEPIAQGRGIGRWALIELMTRAPAYSLHTLLGFIFGHNLPSLVLFERLGFVRWGHLPHVANMDGVMRDLIIVGKKVG